MASNPTSFVRTGLGIVKVMRDLNAIRKLEVFVGIPASETHRTGSVINNASLLFIHTNGSPVNNIPPRPVIEPAIELAKPLISAELMLAAQAVSAATPGIAQRHLKKAGMIAANAAKRYFVIGNNWPPNRPATIRRKGSNRPLINTGQLRRSITYIVADGSTTITAPPGTAA